MRCACLIPKSIHQNLVAQTLVESRDVPRYGTHLLRYGTVRYGTVRYDIIPNSLKSSTAKSLIIQHFRDKIFTVFYGTVRYGTVRYGTTKIVLWHTSGREYFHVVNFFFSKTKKKLMTYFV